MGLVDQVSIEQRRPLLGRDPQAGLHGDVDDLGVVFSPQGLVRAELFLQLHQGRVLVALCHLMEKKENLGSWGLVEI